MPRFLNLAVPVVLGLLLLVSFGMDAYNAGLGGAIDLRNRITGARLMAANIDPYTYKWTIGAPALYCDPYNNPHLPVSKTTSSPAMLGLTLPWAALSYRSGQYLWFFAQWAFLLGTGWLWLRECRDGWQRTLLGVLFTAFTFTASWRLHAERGQSYVVLAFFLAWWLAGSRRMGKRWSFVAGFAAGTLAMLRPPCLLLLPVLAIKRRDQWVGMVVGLLAGLLVPMMFMGNIWTDYGSAMKEHSSLYRNAVYPRAGEQDYPTFIESIPVAVLGTDVAIPYADSSVHVLLKKLGAEPAPGLLVFLAVVIPFGVWCWWVRRGDMTRLPLGLAVWMFLIDFFVPAFRNSYNDVLALNFLALGIIAAPRFWPPLVASGMALVAGIAVYIISPPVLSWTINISTLLFVLAALLYLFAPRMADERTIADERAERKAPLK